jgi:hypothetical protein
MDVQRVVEEALRFAACRACLPRLPTDLGDD